MYGGDVNARSKIGSSSRASRNAVTSPFQSRLSGIALNWLPSLSHRVDYSKSALKYQLDCRGIPAQGDLERLSLFRNPRQKTPFSRSCGLANPRPQDSERMGANRELDRRMWGMGASTESTRLAATTSRNPSIRAQKHARSLPGNRQAAKSERAVRL